MSEEELEKKQANKTNKRVLISVICFVMITIIGTTVIGVQSYKDSTQIYEKDETQAAAIDLSDLFSSVDAWHTGYEACVKEIDSLVIHEDMTAKELIEYLEKYEMVSRTIDKLYLYARLEVSLDNSNEKAIDRRGKATNLLDQYTDKSVELYSYLIELQEEEVKALENLEEFKPYYNFVEDSREFKKEGISGKTYGLFQTTNNLLTQVEDIYNQISYVDGDERSKRPDQFYKRFEERQASLAAVYNMEVSKHKLYADFLGYDSILEYLTDMQGIDIEIYETAKKEIRAQIPLLHRYLKLYSELPQAEPMKISYTEVPEIIHNAFSELGTTYQIIAAQAFKENWIDPYPGMYKEQGAFTVGNYDTHPFIVLNYNQTTQEVGTVAHELGHAIHMEISRKYQDYNVYYPDTSTTEIAAGVTEVSLYEYLIKESATEKQSQGLLNNKVENTMSTLFYQMMIAEFEERAYQAVEKGETLTAEKLNILWSELTKEYFGEQAISNEGDWASIPHLFQDFYTFQYVTSTVASEYVVSQMQDSEMKASWGQFLEAGSSDRADVLIKEVLGIDLADPASYQYMIGELKKDVDQLDSVR